MDKGMVPLSSFGLQVSPGEPVDPISPEFQMTMRFTMAALDPLHPSDNKNKPSTLRILRLPPSDDEEEDEEDEKEQSADVICTLSTSGAFQQPLDLIVTPNESILFEVVGSHPIHLTGNYYEHPYDESDDEEDSDYEEGEGEEEEEEEGDDLDDLDDADIKNTIRQLIAQNQEESESESDEEMQDRIRELVDDEAEEEEEEEESSEEEDKKENTKKPKPVLKHAGEPLEDKEAKKKKVEFAKQLETGPSAQGSTKYPTKKLDGGVVIEDRKTGDGPQAKRGQTVGVRYIGKLKNGKVFDKNTSGKPFSFKLGRGDVIKGWDVGIAGMAVKGERRVIVPAAMAYGKQSLPGIPSNSELTFDVKLVYIK